MNSYQAATASEYPRIALRDSAGNKSAKKLGRGYLAPQATFSHQSCDGSDRTQARYDHTCAGLDLSYVPLLSDLQVLSTSTWPPLRDMYAAKSVPIRPQPVLYPPLHSMCSLLPGLYPSQTCNGADQVFTGYG